VLGITMENGNTFVIAPCIPPTWPGFEVTWKLNHAQVRIQVNNGPQGKHIRQATLNAAPVRIENGVARVTIPSSGREHLVEIQLS
jgi:cyclic beta-1,2-glucan synthetase